MMALRRCCRACDQPVPEEDYLTTDGHCLDCFGELAAGIIPAVMGPVHQSHTLHLTPRQVIGLGKTSEGYPDEN